MIKNSGKWNDLEMKAGMYDVPWPDARISDHQFVVARTGNGASLFLFHLLGLGGQDTAKTGADK